MPTDAPISQWDATAPEPDVAGPLATAGPVDVAIVGGGYTGLSTALHCAEAGLDAVVLEAARIGFGGSGRNVGLVNAAAWMPPADTEAALGPTYGSRFVEQLGHAPAKVFDLIERYQIRAQATRTGTIHAAHAPSGRRDLERRHAQWQRRGAPVDLLDADETARLIGSRRFHGGLRDRRAGTINPMAYCRGLARAARQAGASVVTGTPVRALTRSGRLWSLASDAGTLTAQTVVLATNAYTDALWPGLGNTLTTIHYFQVATQPLGERAADILPERQGVWTTAPIMSSLRKDADGRLFIGSMGRVIGGADRGVTHRWARRELARLFPDRDLTDVAFEDAWHGKIAMTPDHLPRIHRLADGVWTAIGYNGRGITTGTVFGEAIAGLLTGTDPAHLPLPVTDAAPVRRTRLSARLYDAAFTANQLAKAL